MELKKQMKLKNREPKQVDSAPVAAVSTAPAKTAAAIDVAREDVQKAFFLFHELFSNKKLAQNKSEKEKKDELQIVDQLFKAAAQLDQINIGEGTMIIGSIAIRETLKMRDRMNELEYRFALQNKELKELKQELGADKKP